MKRIFQALALCVVLHAGAAMADPGARSGSPQTGGGNDTPTPHVAITSTSLTFGSQAVGTKSSPQVVTVTNNGSTVLGSIKITISGEFAETNNCGTSLRAGAKCSISVTFTPSTTGLLSGTVTIFSNARGGPQVVSLTGTGASLSGAGKSCGGVPITQFQTDVTSQLSYANTAAGVKVTQLTDSGSNRFYYFDVPAYSPAVNAILYVNSLVANEIVTSNTDGTSPQIVSPTPIEPQAFLSPDGTLAYYSRPPMQDSSGALDIYGMFLNSAGACQELRLTNLDVPPQNPLSVWEISGSSPDPAKGQDIVFSPDTLLHRVHVMTNGTSQALSTITLSDPESAATFHRIRLNPKFPNIVIYKRNQLLGTSAQPEVWLVDLDTCTNGTCAASKIINVVANLQTPAGQQPKGGHINWSPDGLDIAFSEPDIADYWIARNVVKVANSVATVNSGFTLQELGPFDTMTSDYCAFPPGWPSSTVLACLAGPASPTNAEILFLMSSDGNGTTKLLAGTDAQVLTIAGTPMPQFMQDGQHLMFNSDRTGVPQIYLITGFTLTVP